MSVDDKGVTEAALDEVVFALEDMKQGETLENDGIFLDVFFKDAEINQVFFLLLRCLLVVH